MLFSYYSGNIHLTKCIGHVSIEQLIKSIKNTKPHLKQIFDDIANEQDKAKRRELKWKLYSFTPSVLINVGLKRSYSNISEWTNFIQIDIDNINNIEDAINLKHKLFDFDYCVTSFLTPSLRGVKALFLINKPNSIEHYKAIHKSLYKYLENNNIKGLDYATKNGVLPMFLSTDKDILYRDIGDCSLYTGEDWSVDERNNIEPNKTSTKSTNDYNRLKNRVLSNSRYLINAIVDNGHPQLLKASLIIGSRVGAGYLSQSDAEEHIFNLIDNNSYLNKNLSGYKKTALWGIKEGIKNPIKFKDE